MDKVRKIGVREIETVIGTLPKGVMLHHVFYMVRGVAEDLAMRSLSDAQSTRREGTRIIEAEAKDSCRTLWTERVTDVDMPTTAVLRKLANKLTAKANRK